MAGVKLELTWPGKNKSFDLEPRILIEKPELSYGDPNTENMLIHWDNLLALKALEQQYTWKVKCIFIDPPYNTGSAFEHYDDWLEHSEWLNLMKPRLELLRNLLSNNWIIFIQIDDNEQAYLKVLCDEIFWRDNYINTLAIKTKTWAGASWWWEDKRLKKNYEFILMYAKDYNQLEYTIPDDTVNLMDYIKAHKDNKIGFYYTRVITNYWDKKYIGSIETWAWEEMKIYEFDNFEFSSISKISKDEWITEEEAYKKYFNDIFMVTNAQTSLLQRVNNYINAKNKLVAYEYVPTTWKSKGKLETKLVWNETLVVRLRDSAKKLDDGTVVKTEKTWTLWDKISRWRLDLEWWIKFKNWKKPEALLEKIISMSTRENDIVLDSFLWSWTTAAAAHKMRRRYIWIELWEQAYTHCKSRLDAVIDWEQSWISELVNWGWGGWYKFYELWPSVLLQDKYWNFIINPNFNSSELVQAICKIENFTYKAYEDNVKHGYSTENDFIHVTTRHITQEIIKDIQETSLKEWETMLIVAKTFESNLDLPSNIQIKKIPTEILDKCEYNKDNYSLPVSQQEIDIDTDDDIDF